MIFPTASRMVNTYGGQVIWLTLVRHKNVFIKSHDVLPSPKHFNNMFQNSENKIRLQEFLKMEFKSKLAQHLGTKFVYSVRECCCNTSTDKELWELTCLHMEADTILFYILPT